MLNRKWKIWNVMKIEFNRKKTCWNQYKPHSDNGNYNYQWPIQSSSWSNRKFAQIVFFFVVLAIARMN